MKVQRLIDRLSRMTRDADVTIRTNVGTDEESVYEEVRVKELSYTVVLDCKNRVSFKSD